MVVVGAGPAGFLAAAAAADAGVATVLLEAGPRGGAKLLITGGGRCNCTNTRPLEDFCAAFGREGRFAEPALRAFGPGHLRDLLASLGVPTRVLDRGEVFPASESARDVRAALEARCRALGVLLRTGTRARALRLNAGRAAGVDTDTGSLEARAVILSTGGASYPATGSTGQGAALATQAGHAVEEPRPALVPLVVQEPWVRACAGVVLEDVPLRLDVKGPLGRERRGTVLFTHRGLSGPAILDLSGDASDLLARGPTVTLRLALTPGIPAAAWEARMTRWRDERGRAMVRTLLDEALPEALARAVVALACPPGDVRANQLTREQRRSLAGLLADAPVSVTGTEGFDRAMVTRGGVPLKEVDPRTLESRLAPGLFFAGEVLDLDGPCGGFNLQWAFSSGVLAGRSAAAACTIPS